MGAIQEKAWELGIDAIGITSAEPFINAKQTLERRQQVGEYPEFVEKDLSLRTNPHKLLPGAKSIISVAIAYKTQSPQDIPHLHGAISRYAWGIDYHKVLLPRIQQLSDFLRSNYGVQQVYAGVDTRPPVERAFALRAGLGYQGHNCCVFVPPYGSWVFLGELIVDQELSESPKSFQVDCSQSCGRCVTACPTNSLYAPYHSNPHICLSYITQMSGIIPRMYRKKMGNKLWGCDVCQSVCPTNREAKCSRHQEFWPVSGTSLPLIPLLSITKSQFRRQFAPTALFWRGKAILQRNAALILGNCKDPVAIEPLADCLTDPKPVLRASAAWALGEIGTSLARDKLARAKTYEDHSEVLSEIGWALES